MKNGRASATTMITARTIPMIRRVFTLRVYRSLRCAASVVLARHERRYAAESPVAAMKLVHSFSQILTGEHRPHARSENHLCVGAFPQQKIAQALFPAGA